MWIRSQCGKILMDCDFFAIEEYGVKYAVITLSGKSSISVSLGTYTTKYKALAVLNDIQEWYKCSYGETFQMPQDDDTGDECIYEYTPKYCPNCGRKIVD